MIAFGAAPAGTRMCVMMPDGYRVWVGPEETGDLFGMVVEGVGEDGGPVTVRGNYITRIHWAKSMPQDITVMDATGRIV